MKMILDDIKKANIEALKAKNSNARAVYGVVMTKAMLETVKKREKNEALTDADMVAILQKTIKELTDEQESFKKIGNAEQANLIEEQKRAISKFLPQLMSEEEIEKVISSLEDKSIPSVMKHFKQNYAGKVDMGKVSSVLKSKF
jgi:uncharacterized protein